MKWVGAHLGSKKKRKKNNNNVKKESLGIVKKCLEKAQPILWQKKQKKLE